MEWALNHIIEILIGGLFASLGAIGVFQMRHNNMSDNADKLLSEDIKSNRQEIDDKHTIILDRMDKNVEKFISLHTTSMQELSAVSKKITETTTELHATNVTLERLTDTVTHVIRDEIPRIKSEITDIRLRQAHCPLYQEYLRKQTLELND